MPKTFTDDIGPALPSALDGPFQVVDPNDIDSYIKVDPENARIEAAGDARPVRGLTVGYTRGYGMSLRSVLAAAMDACSVGPGTDAGFYTTPFFIPVDMDTGETSSVKVGVVPASSGGGGTVARLELLTAYVKDGDTSLDRQTTICDWTTPGGWTPEDLKLVTLDTGSGYTFAADTFESSDIVGLRIRRVGSAVQDTFPYNLLIVTALFFEYTAREI